MNLKISIKNIITNQDRIQNSQGALDSFTVAGSLGSSYHLRSLISLFWTQRFTLLRVSPPPVLANPGTGDTAQIS